MHSGIWGVSLLDGKLLHAREPSAGGVCEKSKINCITKKSSPRSQYAVGLI